MKARQQFKHYMNKTGPFSSWNREMWDEVASTPPHEWWDIFDDEAPELAFVGKRSTAASCATKHSERNWKDYKFIHSKPRRNKLTAKRARDCVYCYHNIRLLRKNKVASRTGATIIPWSIQLDSDSDE